jgi:UDPglucose--hexose-1-phosphate uridylyltransferase
MQKAKYLKPDGRELWLYSGSSVPRVAGDLIPVPSGDMPGAAEAHLRWHPLSQEWVIYAAQRQNRTFQPSAAENPLGPTTDPARPTELPDGEYDIAVFENRFASLAMTAGFASPVPGAATSPALGRCEVVVFSRDPDVSLGQLPLWHTALLLEVWADRTRELAALGTGYVLPFENRGVEMGVTLPHPHGQIYAYGFVPARQRRAQGALADYLRDHGRDLVTDLVAQETDRELRLVAQRQHAAAFVPPYARYPYETWIAPRRSAPRLEDLTPAERDDVAAVLSESLKRLDGLWNRPMPYLLTVNQAPCSQEPAPEWSVRIEIWPVRRAPDRLKFLAGTELGAGVFAADVLPETAAAQLRAVIL